MAQQYPVPNTLLQGMTESQGFPALVFMSLLTCVCFSLSFSSKDSSSPLTGCVILPESWCTSEVKTQKDLCLQQPYNSCSSGWFRESFNHLHLLCVSPAPPSPAPPPASRWSSWVSLYLSLCLLSGRFPQLDLPTLHCFTCLLSCFFFFLVFISKNSSFCSLNVSF